MSKEKTTILVDHKLKGFRADIVISKQSPFLSRSSALKLFEQLMVFVNGLNCKPSYRCKEGDVLTFFLFKSQDQIQLTPSSQNLNILFEDEWILVINKPANLVVHPGAGHSQDTLVNALIAHTKNLSYFHLEEKASFSQGVSQHRPGIVHRLDKDTSGLLVVAKNNLAHSNLVKQFASRLVTRCYWALVFGIPQKCFGQIKTKIARHPKDRKRFCSIPQGDTGKIAITDYKVIKSQNEVSLLHLTLGTGRTHQIRVHLSEQNHPILGDGIYGKKRRISSLKSSNLKRSVENLSRLALHAARLGFRHPFDHRFLEFEIGWPEDLLELLAASCLEL